MLSATIKTPSNRDMHKRPLRRSGGLSLKQNKQKNKSFDNIECSMITVKFACGCEVKVDITFIKTRL